MGAAASADNLKAFEEYTLVELALLVKNTSLTIVNALRNGREANVATYGGNIDTLIDAIRLQGVLPKSILKLILEQLRDATSTNSHNDTLLPAELRIFTPISKNSDVLSLQRSKDLLDFENVILQDPDNDAAAARLSMAVHELSVAMEKAIKTQLQPEKQTIIICKKIIAAGNKNFLQIYANVYDMINLSEGDGLTQYKSQVAAIETLGADACRQQKSDIVEIYRDAARIKPRFDEMIRSSIVSLHQVSIDLTIPAKLKSIARMTEKALLRTEKPKNAISCICDVVRAMIICKSMSQIAAVSEALCTRTDITIVRKKDRFCEAPSSGGWRDLMLNVIFNDDASRHIMEVQIVHASMLTARKGLPGHVMYAHVRNASELYEVLVSCEKLWKWSLADARRAGFDDEDIKAAGFSPKYYPSLINSAARGHITEFRNALEEPAVDPRQSNFNSQTVLHLASQNGHLDLVKFLLDSRFFQIDQVDKSGQTALFAAVESCHIEIVKVLIEEGHADVNSFDKHKGSTPLHVAISSNRLDIVTVLIEKGHADINLADKHKGKTPLQMASVYGHSNIVQVLIKNGYADVNLADKCGETPLHGASFNGHLDIVKLLIEQGGADTNVAEESGQTPLHFASLNGHFDIVKVLVEKGGADLTLTERFGQLPLYGAIYNGHLDIVKLLIERGGADMNLVNTYGQTPVHYACFRGYVDVIKFLIDNVNVDVNLKDKVTGKTLLYEASDNGHLEIVEVLIEKGRPNVNLADMRGRTPLHQAIHNGLLEIVKVLIEKGGADVNLADNDGSRPLHQASLNGHLEIVKVLIEKGGADVNSGDSYNGGTPLHAASSFGHFETVKVLIETYNADISVADNNGRTLLHVAAQNGQVDIFRYLISHHGADMNLADKKGKSALDYAGEDHLHFNEQIIELLNTCTQGQ